ncbi:protein kinase family protein [Salibacterium salarium]|uniref:Protein kinase family protein n=1 Tax=Salibacterium salarium TaxID=284579 RepID=A0A428N0M3_9BACI|nr:protein kinase family protein [Salibacterium salarium]
MKEEGNKLKPLLPNQYTLEAKPRGRGTYGKVYFGFDHKNNRKVAIKITPNVHVAKKEASMMKTYGISQHLPAFYNYFVSNNKAYIIMEAVEGETLGTNNFYYEGKKRTETGHSNGCFCSKITAAPSQ